MAFEGDLSHLALGDVLQTLAMSRQAGIFVVRGPDEERRLVFGPRGCGLLTVRSAVRERVAAYLVGRGTVPSAEHEQAQRTAKRRKDGAIDEILRDQGSVTDADLLEARRYVAADEIYDLFLWSQGSFQFDSSAEHDESPYGNVWFDVAGISMEAARRMDEVGRLRTVCPLGEVFCRAACAAEDDAFAIGRDAAATFALVDGFRTTQGILDVSPIGRFDTWKALDALRESGLVRVATQAEIATAADELRTTGHHDLAASLLRRLLEANPADMTLRHGLVQALTSGGHKREAAAEWIEIGRHELEAGAAAGAVEAFRSAVRLDKENPLGHNGLARALFISGDAISAAESVRTACARHVDAGDVASAIALAELAVRELPDDAGVRTTLANAHIAAGDTAAGLTALDDAASILETSGADERRLVEVYRRIVQLDPARKDCARRIGDAESKARSKRRVIVRKASVGVGAVLVALLAIPLVRGPSFAARVEAARILATDGKADEAQAILDGLDTSNLSDEEKEAVFVVKDTIARKGPKSRAVLAARRIRDQIAVAVKSADEAKARGWASTLGHLVSGLDAFDGADATTLGAADVNELNHIRKGFMDDFANALQAMHNETSGHLTAVMAARERLVPDLFRREDPAALAEAVAAASEVARIRASQDWTEAAKAVEEVQRRVPRVRDNLDLRILESLRTMNEAFPTVDAEGARALAALRKRRLLDQHRETHARGQELMAAGRLDEASDVIRAFLESCVEIRRAEPRELYAPIVTDWVEGAELEAPQRERLAQIEMIRAGEKEADAALEKGDVATAFRIRTDLVRRYRNVDFRPRFRLPLRVESRPAGAEVVLEGKSGGRVLGVTPLQRFEYGVDESLRLSVRMDGFEERSVERRGAIDDEGGVVAVELPKKAEFSAPGLGTVQAPAAAADGRIVVAGRDGKVRLVSDADGSEAAPPFTTGSLAGTTSAPAVVGGRVFVATLDGNGFMLDAATLRKVGELKFDGPVRGSLLALPFGVAAATESGTVQVLSADGRPLWSKHTSRVSCDPALAGRRIVVVTADGDVVAWNAATGEDEVRVRLPEDPRWGAPFGSGEQVFVAGDGGCVACVDLGARKILWARDIGSSVRARPTLAGNALLVVTANGSLLTLDPATGVESSRIVLGAPVRQPPVALHDGFAVATDRGAVLRFDSKGNLVWRFDAKDDISSAPTLVEGRILLATRRGALISLRP
jgi:outer membrane protein assembly factor BamB/tetratricopeptide (TPR) repeat protein